MKAISVDRFKTPVCQLLRSIDYSLTSGFITRRSRDRAPLSLQSPNSQELGLFVDNQWVEMC